MEAREAIESMRGREAAPIWQDMQVETRAPPAEASLAQAEVLLGREGELGSLTGGKVERVLVGGVLDKVVVRRRQSGAGGISTLAAIPGPADDSITPIPYAKVFQLPTSADDMVLDPSGNIIIATYAAQAGDINGLIKYDPSHNKIATVAFPTGFILAEHDPSITAISADRCKRTLKATSTSVAQWRSPAPTLMPPYLNIRLLWQP